MKVDYERAALIGMPTSVGDKPLSDDLSMKITQDQGETRQTLPRKPVHNYLTVNDASINSLPPTPAIDGFAPTMPKIRPASTNAKENHAVGDELIHLQHQLAAAQSKICELEGISNVREPRADFTHFSPFNSKYVDGASKYPTSGFFQFGSSSGTNNPWSTHDDSPSDTSDSLSATGFHRSRQVWNCGKPNQPFAAGFPGIDPLSNTKSWSSRGGNGFMEPAMPHRNAPGTEPYGGSDGISPDYGVAGRGPNNRRGGRIDRFGFPSYGSHHSQYGGSSNSNQHGQVSYETPTSQAHQYPMGNVPYAGQQPSVIGTPLSPLATEFTSVNIPWKTEVKSQPMIMEEHVTDLYIL